jgi:3-hydroxyacyl-CoA dehydrogenase
MTVVSTEIRGSVAVVTVDNPPVNATSQAVRAALLSAVEETEGNAKINAVVLVCAGRTFVAGADVREFDKPPQPPHLPDVISAIESASKPWVAAIHGSALGGGLEIAMGCHARIATTGARLGLPEVTLGLIPGAGGTVRLPRLVPAEEALSMIAGGKPIPAGKAREIGLVDAIAEDNLLEEAIAFASSIGAPTATRDRDVIAPSDAEAFSAQGEKLVGRSRGQISIRYAVNAVERALTTDADTALAQERETFLELKNSPQAAALRHIFFAERATLSDPRCKQTPRPVDQIGVIGGGTMGAGIAAACLLKGLHVTMIERDEAAAESGRKRVSETLGGSVARGLLTAAAKERALARFAVSTEYEALSQADLVIEAVFEDMEVKQEVFERLDQACAPEAVIATNTSYLDVNILAATLRDPTRAIGLHFFSPAHIMKLLEIVVPDRVADDVVATAAAFAKTLGKIAVLAGVCDGFIGNRIMSAYRREADYLLEEGATPDEVDRAMTDFGFAMGVFAMQDLAGLDIACAMRKRRAATRDPSERYVAIADRLCEAGRFGRKTGAGWYDYENGKAKSASAVLDIIAEERARAGVKPHAFTPDEIMARILGAMQAEGQAVLNEGIAQRADDIDVTMINGYGFPRWRGGPMWMTTQ